MAKPKYSIFFNYGVVRVKGKYLYFFLVVKNDLDLAFIAGKPVCEFLGYREQALL